MIIPDSQELEQSALEYWLDNGKLKIFWDRDSNNDLINSMKLVMIFSICIKEKKKARLLL